MKKKNRLNLFSRIFVLILEIMNYDSQFLSTEAD